MNLAEFDGRMSQLSTGQRDQGDFPSAVSERSHLRPLTLPKFSCPAPWAQQPRPPSGSRASHRLQIRGLSSWASLPSWRTFSVAARSRTRKGKRRNSGLKSFPWLSDLESGWPQVTHLQGTRSHVPAHPKLLFETSQNQEGKP